MTLITLTAEIEADFAELNGTLRSHWNEVEDYHFELMQDEDFVLAELEQGPVKLCCPMCGSTIESSNQSKH